MNPAPVVYGNVTWRRRALHGLCVHCGAVARRYLCEPCRLVKNLKRREFYKLVKR